MAPRRTKTEQERLASKLIIRSREKVLSWLMEHGLPEKEARNIEEQIAISVRHRMADVFSFRTGPRLFDYRPYSEFLEPLVEDYPDFVNWAYTATSILFYQSIGDTIGYYNGRWEFNHGNPEEGPDYVNELLYEFIHLGGINGLDTNGWLASDDTILYLTTFDTIISGFNTLEKYASKLRRAYLQAMPRIRDRHPGYATMESLREQRRLDGWNKLPYNNRTVGNGSVMRAGCVGIFNIGSERRRELIEMAVETSRITHNSAPAILGCITTALFTSLALERTSINLWPQKLLELVNSGMIDEYLKESRPHEYDFYVRDKILYIGQWRNYLDLLFIGVNPRPDLKIMINAVQRYKYLAINFSKDCGIVGGCAHDSLIMAYDSLLRSGGNIEKLLVYSILHPGDSDTVGSIAFSWFAAYYNSPHNESLIANFKKVLELHDEIDTIANNSLPFLMNSYFSNIYQSFAREILFQYLEHPNSQNNDNTNINH